MAEPEEATAIDDRAGIEHPPGRGLWTTVREAIRGSEHDYTQGPLGRSVLLLAIPMVAEMLMESLFAVVDIFWVSKLGADAAATVGLTESMLALIYAVAIGLSIGAMAVVARRIGEKDPERAARGAFGAIVLGVCVALPIGAFGAMFAPELLELMGASESVVSTGSRFTAIMLGGNVVIVLLFIINAIFRGCGDPAIAMRVLWLANGLNIVLGPCFIFGLGPFPKLGVAGAAVATTIGRGTGVIFQLYLLGRGRSRVAIRRRHLALEPAAMLAMLRLSGSAVIQALVATASWVALVRIVSTFGSAAVAGYTIGIRIVIFALLPSWGLSNAAATMVGQNLGAGRPDRAERAVSIAGFYNMVCLGLVGAVFVVLAGPIVRLFISDPEVLPYGIDCLRFVSFGFLFYAWGMVFTQALNGAGDTWTATLINFFCFWLLEIPLAWVLAKPLDFGPRGAFIAVTVAFSTFAVVGGIVFRRGRWKLKRV